MKHETESEKLTDNQKLKSIRNVTSGKYLTNLIVRQDLNISNIFLIQNKGKGPPGRTRSPGLFPEHPPDTSPDRFSKPVRTHRTVYNIENEIAMCAKVCTNLKCLIGYCMRWIVRLKENVNTQILRHKAKICTHELLIHTKPNHYSQLNFTIMKKRLFILILAVFAINVAWGQAVHHSLPRDFDPTPGVCQDDALHPLAGKPYQYGVTTNPSGGTYEWIATKDVNLMTNKTLTGNTLSVTSAGLIQFDNATSQTATIAWSSQVLDGVTATPTSLFVAVKYTTTTPCTTDNFKVYPIVPFKAFTIDLLSMDLATMSSTTYGGTTSQCYSQVVSAKYDGTTGILYDYGVNVLWYELVAANFVGNYKPSFQLSGLQGTQTATVEWGYTTNFATAEDVLTGTGSGTLTYTGTKSVTTNETSTYNGVSIFVKVTISNNSWEGAGAAQPITLAAVAQDKDGQWDVLNTSNNQYNTCTDGTNSNYDDTATQDLYARPTVIPNQTNPGFLPKTN